MASPGADPAPVWVPDPGVVERANLTDFMGRLGIGSYAELHRWSVGDRAAFWGAVVERLGIEFARPPAEVLDLSAGVESPCWLAGARLNIVESCFRADVAATAVVHGVAGERRTTTYGQLQEMAFGVAAGLRAAGVGRGDRVAIAMPMTLEAVAAYLGIVALGAVVVSIADSFAPEEIAARLGIAGASLVVTQDRIRRGGKDLPMYEKVTAAGPVPAVVVDTGAGVTLRAGDVWWAALGADPTGFEPVACGPGDHTNVLFSSGTTGEPKAIPWTHASPIKAAMDGHFHQDIHAGDVVAWPTNLGWMMGPWLIYASLVNGAAMALCDDVPTGRGFGEFVQDAGVTMLGLVPSLVAAWRGSGCLAGLDWSVIRVFSSTGEASNAADMAWLMEFAGGKPVIEYCGGTEIAGGYITGTVLQPAVPAAFSTAALGIDVRILDEAGQPAPAGELFLVPPSIGMSVELLNRDHHEAYYAGVPQADVPLRRHGDYMEALPGGYYRAHGRVDDTMNLGGIKVSSAEIERVVAVVPGVAEAAAVAVPPEGGGPERLVIFAVPEAGVVADADAWQAAMQAEIRSRLNPLFKIAAVVAADALPRTASAKVMRRELRRRFAEEG